jgi:hypothetical protein
MPNPYANYYEHHESRESICAPEHVPECSLCHEENACETIEFEGKEVKVGNYCYLAIKGMDEGRI